MMTFFPLRKIKRNGKYVLFVGVLVFVGFAGYLEYVATSTWDNVDDIQQKEQKACTINVNQDHVSSKNIVWSSKYVPQPWRQEYKGRANLHVFEDWCGSSVASLRKNPHFPQYPHSRNTVKKLAVSPSWKNYGLRIFGYIHPYTSGEFLFAVASAVNCEFWLSDNENPENLRLRAYVGKTGEEWTAPGEYSKYTSQMSRPVLLQQQKKFFFELIHKHNDQGTDHVEVAWRLNEAGKKFEIIDSKSLSLYTDESFLKISDVSHIPQTSASHVALQLEKKQDRLDRVQMLREDSRDTFFKTPLLDKSQLWGLLPECFYRPTFTVKDRMIGRYEGLHFVHLTYVYPNDYTRLTHMENSNTCFYKMKPYYLKMYGFSWYMRLDQPEEQDTMFRDNDDYRAGWKDRAMRRGEEDEEIQHEEEFHYRDDYVQQQQRKLFSNSLTKKSLRKRKRQNKQDMNRIERVKNENLAPDNNSVSVKENHNLLQNQNNLVDEEQLQKGNKMVEENKHLLQRQQNITEEMQHKRQKGKKNKKLGKNQHRPQRQDNMVEEKQPETQNQNKLVDEGRFRLQTENKMVNENQHLGWKDEVPGQKEDKGFIGQVNHKNLEHKAPIQDQSPGARPRVVNRLKNDTEIIFLPMPNLTNPQPHEGDSMIQKDPHGIVNHTKVQDGYGDALSSHTGNSAPRTGRDFVNRDRDNMQNGLTEEEADLWVLYGDSKMEARSRSRAVYDPEIRWNQTFDVSQTDFQMLRSDWIDLNCNVSGNLMISQSEVTAVVQAFMEKLELKYPRRFSLLHIVNVEKKVDEGRGSRYLLELELMESSRGRVRLVNYVYVLKRRNVQRPSFNTDLLLCNPHNFLWNPDATIHIIVPVKNQARWVKRFIVDMEELHQVTGDKNINIIITDYSSTDMDIEEALKNSHLPMYQYVRLTGSFERSAGLQAGIDLITDNHSIVFLCDLHLHFPPGFFDSVRKHCVEGHMAFAPLVMRLNCGATPEEPEGYWEVNGFGLLGIYKSDMDAVGGMNTREFKNRWGGEDWELLDRIVEAGLEVERLHLRNFFHYHHSRRGMWNHKPLSST
ncbi:beta-1,4-N-acetylgalactosaminyltransferase 3 [Tachysurus vachellii]|uniref:beta-1,4-N-acetylgalactosaminyltransferase 3 n=1 Tax=Tachysurus vachellii TaxID=175792 RepID=UPI00296B39BE|nr:beta-1,4-N-acetylgalactosaminyltransferase 3 [Tachysurus vachellii]